MARYLDDRGKAFITKVASALAVVIGAGFLTGGLMVATTASSIPLIATGALVAFGGAAAVYGGIKNYDRDDLVGEFLDATTDLQNSDLSKAEKKEQQRKLEEAFDKKVSVLPAWTRNPVVKTAWSAAEVVAGVVLWPVGGFVATTCSLMMIGFGGISTVKGLIALEDKVRGLFSRAPAKEKDTGSTSAAPTADLSPASKLDGVSAGKDFNATTGVKPATATQPTQILPPPSA